MKTFRASIICTLVAIAAVVATSGTMPFRPEPLLAQTGGGNAATDNSGVNAEIAELQSALAETQSALAEAQADVSGIQAELGDSQSDLAETRAHLADALVAIDALLDAQEDAAEAVTALQATLGFVRVEQGEINGLAGPHLILEGCNVHVRSGSGATDDHGEAPTGLGNLIVGYNELDDAGSRGGAHNLVVGADHTYISVGGLVAGESNSITAHAASVTGGFDNEAASPFSAVSGGAHNTAFSGWYATVSGGTENKAQADYATVSGGRENIANGEYSAVSGGFRNQALGIVSVVSGGALNTAFNLATASTVSGGNGLSAHEVGEHVP